MSPLQSPSTQAGAKGVSVEPTTASRAYIDVDEDVEEVTATWSMTKTAQTVGRNRDVYEGELHGKAVAVGLAKQGNNEEESLRAECFRHEEVVDEAASATYGGKNLFPVYACVDTLEGDSSVVGIVLPKATAELPAATMKKELDTVKKYEQVVRQLTAATADMHEAKYAHRNINPMAVVLGIKGEPAGCGDPGCAYLSTFGSMVHVDASPEYTGHHMNAGLVFAGTNPFFMPREMGKYAKGDAGEKYKMGTELLTEAEVTMQDGKIKDMPRFVRVPRGAWFMADVYSLGATLITTYGAAFGGMDLQQAKWGEQLFDDSVRGEDGFNIIAKKLDEIEVGALQEKMDEVFKKYPGIEGCHEQLLRGMLAIDPELRLTAAAAAAKAIECFGDAGHDEL